MPRRRSPSRAAGAVLLLALSTVGGAASAADLADAGMAATIAALDAEMFDAFNHCADPAQMERHASHFDDAVEFYHDTGGVTWTRDAMLDNTRRHACGRYVRQLVAGSLQVHPIAGFGAISQGSHRFCGVDTGRCDGLADFTMVWRLRDGRWSITRVLSYGHRAAAD